MSSDLIRTEDTGERSPVSPENPIPAIRNRGDPLWYFQKRLRRAELISACRFPDRLDFQGKIVLDVGSGYGATSTFMGLSGAEVVHGIEPEERSYSLAAEILEEHYPELREKVKFFKANVDELPQEETYDIAVSFAVFEHVLDPPGLLNDIWAVMKRGGKFYLGIGPLYRWMWGDHRRTKAPLSKTFPWAHLLFSEESITRNRNRKFPNEQIARIQDLGLNCLPLSAYLEAIEKSRFIVDFLEINRYENRFVTRTLNLLRKLPGMNDLFAKNIYCILRKPQ